MMSRPLATLLRVRQLDEQDAEQALRAAAAVRVDRELRQLRLDEEAQQAERTLREAQERRLDRQTAQAVSAADMLAHVAYLARLRTELARCREAARGHRDGALSAAHAAEANAATVHRGARQAREMIEKQLEANRQAAARTSLRREEDRMSDLANAAHARRGDRKD